MHEKWEIYVLLSPRSKRVRYIGSSKDAQKRFKQHIADAQKFSDKRPLYRWIRNLLNKSAVPLLQVVERGCGEGRYDREEAWIDKFARSHLLNMIPPRQVCVGPEGRKRAGEKLKNRYFSPDHRRRISQAKTGKSRRDRETIIARCHEMARNNRGRKMNLSPQERERRRRHMIALRAHSNV